MYHHIQLSIAGGARVGSEYGDWYELLPVQTKFPGTLRSAQFVFVQSTESGSGPTGHDSRSPVYAHIYGTSRRGDQSAYSLLLLRYAYHGEIYHPLLGAGGEWFVARYSSATRWRYMFRVISEIRKIWEAYASGYGPRFTVEHRSSGNTAVPLPLRWS